jgi:hypothetical protein
MHCRIWFFVAVIVCCGTTVAALQHEAHQAPGSRLPDPGSRTGDLQSVEPLRCWRQSSAGAVVLGESFTVTLTCAVFESADAQVVPDESRLNVATIQMAPFEILGGSHPPDVRRGLRRFVQYDYQLRIIGRDAIGQDVNVPPLSIPYRVHSRVGAAAQLEGRDLSYLMPAMPIRVLSLVPADAGDIRDSSAASLATVSALGALSRRYELIAYALGALALVVAVLALVPLTRRRAKAEAGPALLPDRAVLKHACDALADVQARAAHDGWSDERVAAALSAMRLIAATAIGRPVSQHAAPRGAPTPEGRLLVRAGAIGPLTSTVSSSITADEVGRAASRNAASITLTRGHHLEGLQSGLALLTAALYRQSPSRQAAELNEAVRHAISVGREVAAERSWWRSWARR